MIWGRAQDLRLKYLLERNWTVHEDEALLDLYRRLDKDLRPMPLGMPISAEFIPLSALNNFFI